MSDRPLIVWFDEDREPASDLLGGKVTGLAEMTRSGLDVPAGFAVTTAAHERFAAAGLDGLDGLDGPLAGQVRAAYAELGRRLGVTDPPVAVRSSGQAEDIAEASFAGQYDTYLWVTGAGAVVDHVGKVWQSSLRARDYRQDRALASTASLMCVGVQLMVEARTAGVMFTLNPLNGDRSVVMIESSWGLGEAVVKGDVHPDRYSVSKVTGTVVATDLGDKQHEYRFDPGAGGVARVPVADARRRAACLSPAEIGQLAALGKRVEKLRGAPQDIEWAIDAAGRTYLLQVRPETVWSARSPTAADPPPAGNAVGSVIASFVRGGR
jgi:pyruvate, water dikinase